MCTEWAWLEWLSWFEHCLVHQKAPGSVPGQHTYPGCGFDLRPGHVEKNFFKKMNCGAMLNALKCKEGGRPRNVWRNNVRKFPKFLENLQPTDPKAQWIPKHQKHKKASPSFSIIKLLKVIDKGKIWKQPQEKRHCRGTKLRTQRSLIGSHASQETGEPWL